MYGKSLTHALIFVVAAALFCGIARADSIVVNGVDTNRGMGSANGNDLWIFENGTTNENAYFAGVIVITVSNAGGTPYLRDSLCVDLFTGIGVGGSYTTTVLHPDQVSGKHLGRVSWLVDNVLPSVAGPAQGAGLQLAIWDIVHDGGDGFSTGNVRASPDPAHPTNADALGYAVTYEAMSDNKYSDLAFVYDNRDGYGREVQMLIGPQFSDGGPSPVPEPSDLMLGVVLVLGGCLVQRRLRLRRAEAPARPLR
jgi:hypothetical protein